MNYHEFKGGHIEIICGPMFAGKTEELIRRIRRLEYAKKKYLVFKPIIDNRYANNMIVSHNKSSIDAINISEAKEIYTYLNDDILAVVIDEAQFFNEELVQIVQDLAKKGHRVILGGLDLDFRGEPFSIMPKLLALAEDVTKLTAICVCCGSLATRTQRLVNNKPAYYDDDIVLVGASENYEARCRKCHTVLYRNNKSE